MEKKESRVTMLSRTFKSVSIKAVLLFDALFLFIAQLTPEQWLTYISIVSAILLTVVGIFKGISQYRVNQLDIKLKKLEVEKKEQELWHTVEQKKLQIEQLQKKKKQK